MSAKAGPQPLRLPGKAYDRSGRARYAQGPSGPALFALSGASLRLPLVEWKRPLSAPIVCSGVVRPALPSLSGRPNLLWSFCVRGQRAGGSGLRAVTSASLAQPSLPARGTPSCW